MTPEELIALLSSGDETKEHDAAEQLIQFQKPEVVAQKIITLSKSPTANLRWWAIYILAHINIEGDEYILIDALADDDSGVQACAAMALSQKPIPLAIPHLLALLDDENQLLARLAGNALISIGKPATSGLIEYSKTSIGQGKIEAIRAIALIGDTDTIATLFKLLDDDSALINYWVDEGLERMGVGMTFFKP